MKKQEIDIRNSFDPSSGRYNLTVFIDIFRASTTMAYLFRAGIDHLLGINEYSIIKDHLKKGYTLISEVYGDGLDNSPTEVLRHDLKGKKIIIKTGNLITSIFNNLDFQNGLVVGFVNLSESARYILNQPLTPLEIIASSHFEEKLPAIEDLSCAEYLRSILLGTHPEDIPYHEEIFDKINARKVESKDYPKHYFSDLDLALQKDSLPMVMGCTKMSAMVVKFFEITNENPSLSLERGSFLRF